MNKARYRIHWITESLMCREMTNAESIIVSFRIEPINIQAQIQIHDYFWQTNQAIV